MCFPLRILCVFLFILRVGLDWQRIQTIFDRVLSITSKSIPFNHKESDDNNFFGVLTYIYKKFWLVIMSSFPNAVNGGQYILLKGCLVDLPPVNKTIQIQIQTWLLIRPSQLQKSTQIFQAYSNLHKNTQIMLIYPVSNTHHLNLPEYIKLRYIRTVLCKISICSGLSIEIMMHRKTLPDFLWK